MNNRTGRKGEAGGWKGKIEKEVWGVITNAKEL